MSKPTIDQYLLSTCLFIIDEFNGLYKDVDKKELKRIADETYNEMDICVKIGYPFRQMAHYTVGDKKKNKEFKVNHDIYISTKDFKIEVKYLKNWKTIHGTYANSKVWKVYKDDFDWLFNEIDNNEQGKRAVILGWFNCVEYFAQFLQLGQGLGNKPLANEEKVSYFPFLRKTKVPTLTSDLVYNYESAYKILPVNLIGELPRQCNCLFLGNEEDVFHFAIYF
ncbi:MAG TPA: hypothetical protein GX707_17460 [Epulopiscium sp.]|nr:hypothetical protein [Candidatus Epulonipiscium sp.]